MYPPVFLLGFWRSGTTLLHELLCCDPQFGFPSTYACLNPSHFLLSEAWAKTHAPSTSRPMDNMSYSWASPQEDEFALLSLGAPSPYAALLVPSLMRDAGSLVDLRLHTAAEQKWWMDTLQLFLRLLTVQQHKRMVLKSPPHGFKFPLLLAMFPDARYIVIERNPYEVFASNLKLWRTMLEQYALESWEEPEIEKFVLEAYITHEQLIGEGTRAASSHQFARVRYEHLVADPVGEVQRLYKELDLGNFETAREGISRYSRTVSSYKRNQFVISPSQRATVDKFWGPLIQAKSYSWPAQYLTVAN